MAVATAVTVTLIGAPAAFGAPAAASTERTESNLASPLSLLLRHDTAPSTLPSGSFAVRKASAVDTFALFDGESRFVADDPGFNPNDIVITLPNIGNEDRAFVLVADSALDIVTEDGLGHTPYAPAAHGNGDRTFAFEVTDDGAIGVVRDTTPEPGDEDGGTEDGDEGSTPRPSPSPTVDPSPSPTVRPPTPAPTPTRTPGPPPQPTADPSPGPSQPPGDGDDGGGNEGDSGSDDSGDSRVPDGGVTEDPSTGNGADRGNDSSGPASDGGRDWVPSTPRRPDYSDPVPQPPGADENDAITPETDGFLPQADDDEDGDDNIATDSASDDGGAAVPWQIAVVVGIGAAAIGFILLVVGRNRRN